MPVTAVISNQCHLRHWKQQLGAAKTTADPPEQYSSSRQQLVAAKTTADPPDQYSSGRQELGAAKTTADPPEQYSSGRQQQWAKAEMFQGRCRQYGFLLCCNLLQKQSDLDSGGHEIFHQRGLEAKSTLPIVNT
jgi:hypothetical protein